MTLSRRRTFKAFLITALAYGKAMRDPSLIDEAKKGQMDLEHTPGEELQAQIKELLNQPREVVDLVKKILAD